MLSECLSLLCPQLDTNDEILVVNNGLSQPTKNIVLAYTRRAPVKYLYEKRKGPSFARNLGVKHAKKDIVAFLDDDCLVSSKWISSIKQTIIKDEKYSNRTVYQGKIVHHFLRQTTMNNVFIAQNDYGFAEYKKRMEGKKRLYMHSINAGNFFAKRNIFDSLPYVFDAIMFPYIGEEMELTNRLQLKGYVVVYRPSVVVQHIISSLEFGQSACNLFLRGRTMGILEHRYGVRKVILKKLPYSFLPIGVELFNSKSFMFVLQRLTSKQPSSAWLYVPVVGLKYLLYATGRLYGRIFSTP